MFFRQDTAIPSKDFDWNDPKSAIFDVRTLICCFHRALLPFLYVNSSPCANKETKSLEDSCCGTKDTASSGTHFYAHKASWYPTFLGRRVLQRGRDFLMPYRLWQALRKFKKGIISCVKVGVLLCSSHVTIPATKRTICTNKKSILLCYSAKHYFVDCHW